jgi:E1A/CREB-binding protein
MLQGTVLTAAVRKILLAKKAEDNVTVRCISNLKREQLPTGAIKEYYGKYFAESLPYRSRSICAFQRLEGRDVLFFAMFVQEYGADCPKPNFNTLYISYLDSLKYFTVSNRKKWRTSPSSQVKKAIVKTYLQTMQRRGFNDAFIWASAPKEGFEYIFHKPPPMPQRVKTTRICTCEKETGNCTGEWRALLSLSC